jgi:hypothetical protein
LDTTASEKITTPLLIYCHERLRHISVLSDQAKIRRKLHRRRGKSTYERTLLVRPPQEQLWVGVGLRFRLQDIYLWPGLDLFEHFVRACFESLEFDLRKDAIAVIHEPQTELLLSQIGAQ